MTIQEIRQDLRDIRYYYSKKEQFDRASNIILPKALLEKIERYQKAMQNAPARLLDLYISLYVQNRSQAALAYEWNYTRSLRYGIKGFRNIFGFGIPLGLC